MKLYSNKFLFEREISSKNKWSIFDISWWMNCPPDDLDFVLLSDKTVAILDSRELFKKNPTINYKWDFISENVIVCSLSELTESLIEDIQTWSNYVRV